MAEENQENQEEKASPPAPSVVETALKEVQASVGSTLFELTDDYAFVLEAIELAASQAEGEIPDELYERLEELEEAVEVKLENYIRLYKELGLKQSGKLAVSKAMQIMIQPVLDEIQRYSTEATAIEREMVKLRERAGDRMEFLARQDPGKFRKKLTKKEKENGKKQGNPFFKCESGTLWTQDNPPGVQLLVEPGEVPVKFFHEPREEWVNKGGLKEILEDPEHEDHEKAREIAAIDQTRGARFR